MGATLRALRASGIRAGPSPGCGFSEPRGELPGNLVDRVLHVGRAGRQLGGGVDLLEHDHPVADGGPDERVAALLERAKTPTPSPIDRQWSVAARHRAIIRARAPGDKRAALGLRRAKASRRSPRAPKVAG